jgi:Tripartite tricarboxylate transporter TctB family.
MERRAVDRTNVVCGVFFVVAGLFFAIQSLDLEIGTAFRMGPGYFPLILSGLLVLLGVVIIVSAFRSAGEPLGDIAWRGIVLILIAPIVFGLTVRGLGFVAAIFLTTMVASFASARMTVVPAVVLSVLVTLFAVVVFSYGLGLPFARFGPWLRF